MKLHITTLSAKPTPSYLGQGWSRCVSFNGREQDITEVNG